MFFVLDERFWYEAAYALAALVQAAIFVHRLSIFAATRDFKQHVERKLRKVTEYCLQVRVTESWDMGR